MSFKEAMWLLFEPQEVWQLFPSSSMESKVGFAKANVITLQTEHTCGRREFTRRLTYFPLL